MKKYLKLVFSVTFCAILILSGKTNVLAYEEEETEQTTNSLDTEEIKEKIIDFLKTTAPNRMIIRLNILEITQCPQYNNIFTQVNNFLCVYFLEGQSPESAKDFNNIIDSSKVQVLLARFQYSILNKEWTVERIDRIYNKTFTVKD